MCPEEAGQGLSLFIDRAAALVEERRSQICLGLDPDPAGLGDLITDRAGRPPAEAAAEAVAVHCRRLIELAGPSCVAVKPQLACFERLGWPGWKALAEVCEAARQAGLLVIADGKRGDVPVTAKAYGQAMVGTTESPFGTVDGLGADAFTANPLLGEDALEPMVAAAEASGAGVFALVRTSNPGAADVEDLVTPEGPVHERLAVTVDRFADRLAGQETGLSGMGAVVGATAPEHIARLRELMPSAIFLIPGVGAQGGKPEDLGAAFAPGRAAAMIAASRSIAGAEDPAGAAEELRSTVWTISG
ncbi:MAG: orotidine-5'-phosphate decarboxylase [Thermoleophilales bacterium]|nr:orotidine-5'-phosphate decarboxylase [Thermoleophilales bacterium]